ncbi:MAG: hypothetical protein QUS33_08485 [Dehalococcoidia bacterium]|nr:hypothetical protein [Dehalococcoidia bacterium]
MSLGSLLQEVLDPPPLRQPLVLGEAIPWRKVEGHFLCVRWCSFFATIEDGAIEADPEGAYAVLGVESPALSDEAIIVVSSKTDFRHLWELYRERRVADDEEVLLIYSPADPKRVWEPLRRGLPCLDIMVYPKGHCREAYDPQFVPRSWAAWHRERARWKPFQTAMESAPPAHLCSPR